MHHYYHRALLISLVTIGLTACGGGSNGSSKYSTATLSSSAPASSIANSSAVEVSSAASSISDSITSSATASSAPTSSPPISSIPASSSSSSNAGTTITVDMANGWRGNGTGNAGITYDSTGVAFNALADNIGAVTDLAKPVILEGAVINLLINASAEFKLSGASLQIFAQLKGDWGKGEWDCTTSNSELPASIDISLTCAIDEADKKFNQSTYDVQFGIQAKGTPAGTVTIKSATVTLPNQGSVSTSSTSSSATSAYSANVANLHALASFPIGAAVSNNDSPTYNILTNAAEKSVVEKHFDQMTAGNIMKMSYLQSTQGNFTFAQADAFVDYAKSKNINVHGHALVWHSDYQVPGFMKNWTGSSADFITVLQTHVTTIVDHFETKGNLVSWDVVNEALNDNNPSNFRTDSAFYSKSGNSAVYIEKAFQAARAADANVELYYNDYNTDQNGAKMTKLEEMITDFQTRNIPIDGIGFQMHVFMDYPSIANISAAMKKVVDKGLKVKITELDVAVNNPYSGSWPASKISSFNEATALAQKKRYCEIIKAYIDTVPANLRGGISVWGTTDANTWLNDLMKGTTQYNGDKISWPLLFDDNYQDKPALRGFADALQGISCN